MVQAMISFKQFLNEAAEFDLEKFKKDCAHYLSMLKGTQGQRMLYRGSHDAPKDFRIEDWKERAGPRDSSLEMHDQINAYFEDKFGVKARDWMFCTGSYGDAAVYSPGHKSAMVIFPIGEFEWLAAIEDDAHDMTGFYDRCRSAINGNAATKVLPYDDKKQLAIDMMKHKMEKWQWKDSEDIVGCIKSRNEIMFRCDKFYVFNYTGSTFTSQEFKDFIYSI